MIDDAIDDSIDEAIVEDDNPDQSQRTEAWLDAFQSQLTEKMSERVRRFARPRALNVAYAGRKVDDYYVRELVQDAIGDTLGRTPLLGSGARDGEPRYPDQVRRAVERAVRSRVLGR